MHANSKIALAVVAGTALGAAVMQGLHAQAKSKACSVAEIEILNAASHADYLSKVRTAIASHGHAFRTLNGRVVSIEGSPPPQHAANPQFVPALARFPVPTTPTQILNIKSKSFMAAS